VEMAAAVEQRLRYKDPGFSQTLLRAEALINDYDLKEHDAVSVAQALNDYARDLQLIPALDQEKK